MDLTHDQVILGVGANLPGGFGTPRAACGAALERIGAAGVDVLARSSWYESAPVPLSDQPWYVNAVAVIETDLKPLDLLALFIDTEKHLGRVRGRRNAPRVIDLDLLAFGTIVRHDDHLAIPHPRLHERAFVVVPLGDVAPRWRHPESGLTAAEMAAKLPAGQRIRRMADAEGLFGTEWTGRPA